MSAHAIFRKADTRINAISKEILEHYLKFIEPSGFKAFIVAVDREACDLYKEAINKYLKERNLPEDYVKTVYTRDQKDNGLLRKYLVDHIQRRVEKQPYLLSISEEIEKIITRLKERQTSVETALQDLTKLAQQIAASEEEQMRPGLDKEEFSIFWILRSHEVRSPETLAGKIYKDIVEHKEWPYNEKLERTLRRNLYKLLLKSTPKNQLVELVNNLLKMHRILIEGRKWT